VPLRDRTQLVAALGLALILMVAALPVHARSQAGYDEAINTILCDCGCHPQTVKECACGRAAEMRGEIRTMIEGGMSGQEVIAAYVAKHGEQIRVAPVAAGFNLLAWLGPLVALVAASGGLVLLVRRWNRVRSAAASRTAAPAPDSTDPFVQRLRRELEELE
jgi:cytochrome c-type biogenesis protein CcmH/NrfF